MPQIILILRTPTSTVFHGLTALVGLGLLIFEALCSHLGMDYTGLLYMLDTSKFTITFKLIVIDTASKCLVVKQ